MYYQSGENPWIFNKRLLYLKQNQMKTYVYYSKTDTTKEPLSSVQANDITSAAKRFAGIKKLSINEFTKLFEIEEKRG